MSDKKYLAWVREQPCIFDGHDPCEGDVEAHHVTGAGLSLKAPDRNTMPLCRKHHRQRHDHKGPFHDWSKAKRKAWEALMVEHYQSLHDGTFTDPF